ncbi:hypothetical protein Ancab_034357 [Ancistrocladus abbreviatus]
MASSSESKKPETMASSKKYEGCYELIPLNLTTLANMEERGFGSSQRMWKGTKFSIHDYTSPGYEWLLPGWLAEERIVTNGRLYRYYYDPAGLQYRAKYQVLDAWKKMGLSK